MSEGVRNASALVVTTPQTQKALEERMTQSLAKSKGSSVALASNEDEVIRPDT
jgi:hypothetical protein